MLKKTSDNHAVGEVSKALAIILLLLSIHYADAQVLRKGVTDTEADPVIPDRHAKSPPLS